MLKRVALLLPVLILILSMGLPVSAQTAGGTISGQLNNGTAGGSGVSGIEVRLETYVNAILTANSTVKTQNDGNFQFNDLVTDPQNKYRIAITFQDADYFTGDIAFGQGETSKSQNVTVYDSTVDPNAVAVETAHTIIIPGKDELEITAVYDFVNTTDRAYVGVGEVLANGKKKTLTFSLPADATDIRQVDGLIPNYVFPSHGGFIDTLAVMPGVREVVYTYKVPFKGGAYKFNEKLNYSAEWFNLLVEGENVKVASNQLKVEDKIDLGGKIYLYLVGQNFSSGQTVSATLSGLPGAINQTFILVIVGVALVIVIGVGLAYWRMRARRKLSPVAQSSEFADDEQSLLIELARLDDEFAAGRIPEPVYQAQRAAKKARLIKLMSVKRG